MKTSDKRIILIILTSFTLCTCDTNDKITPNKYVGIWFEQLFENGTSKYSGGMATYSEKHRPIAIYNKTFHKTYFVFGGSNFYSGKLQVTIGYYDHHLNKFSEPEIVWEKETLDPHENASISIDNDGFIYVFANAHGNRGEARVFKSVVPGEIYQFETIYPYLSETGESLSQFSYLQVWYDKVHGFLGVFTRYGFGTKRTLCFARSLDGRNWVDFKVLSTINEGSYHISTYQNNILYVAFDQHPPNENGPGIDSRSNLYLIYSSDQGKSWSSFESEENITSPINKIDNNALVFDTHTSNFNLHLKDIITDKFNRPVVLFSENERTTNVCNWYLAEWSGGFRKKHLIGITDHPFDMGAMSRNQDELTILCSMGFESGDCGGNLRKIELDLTNYRITGIREYEQKFSNYQKAVVNGLPDFEFFWCTGDPNGYSEVPLFYMNNSEILRIE